MRPREIDHMDIVAHARAVGRIVVVAENSELGQLADGHFGNIRTEIVGYAARIFPDKSGLMRADGVEIPQYGDIETVVRLVKVF